MMMDKIIIEDLEVYAYHGVNKEEKVLGQMFLVTLEIGLDLQRAALTGDLDATVNYAKVCDTVKEIMLTQKCDLIETTAMKIIKGIFNRFENAETIKIILKKPWAPTGHHLKYAAVELERTRGECCGK